MMRKFGYYLFVVALIALSAAARLIPHIPNVSPIAAIALLGGATLSLPWSLAVPLAAMLASDFFIGFDEVGVTLAVYGSFIVTVLLGRWLKNNRSPWRILGTSLAASTSFYLVTNAAVWEFSGLYPQTLDGLMLSYLYAIPFYRLTLLGDMAYVFSLFLAVQYAPKIVYTARHEEPVLLR